MRIFRELAQDLIRLGHDTDTVYDEGLVGADDRIVVGEAKSSDRILLTLDIGIANLLQYPTSEHSGVVLFRPDVSGRNSVSAFVRERLEILLKMDLKDRLTVVSATRIRVRQNL